MASWVLSGCSSGAPALNELSVLIRARNMCRMRVRTHREARKWARQEARASTLNTWARVTCLSSSNLFVFAVLLKEQRLHRYDSPEAQTKARGQVSGVRAIERWVRSQERVCTTGKDLNDKSSCSSPAGWLLDITKLTLGDNIGEGEFGGEFSSSFMLICQTKTSRTRDSVQVGPS